VTKKDLKLYVIAGEASGDLHASNLMKAMKAENDAIDFRCWGGDKMAEQGGFLVKHIKELAFMGFLEVIANLRTILKNIKYCKADILDYKPDALILIDYPGFNLRIAEWAKKNGILVIYYISPQVWAWKQSRVHKIKKSVDSMYVILPFEEEFYAKFDFPVNYMGHPLVDAIEQYRKNAISEETFRAENKLDNRPIIALLPGSRKQEVRIKLPIMLAATQNLGEYQIVVAGAPSLSPNFYSDVLSFRDVAHTQVIFDQTYNVLSFSEAAIVTSGTATLETALLGIPEVVCYKGSELSYQIAKRLIKIPYISLVNLILMKETVKELIQSECNAENIRKHLALILKGGVGRSKMLLDFDLLKKNLGEGGASAKIAHAMLKTIQDRRSS
jgi:lipid-A-disaccharide synthase